MKWKRHCGGVSITSGVNSSSLISNSSSINISIKSSSSSRGGNNKNSIIVIDISIRSDRIGSARIVEAIVTIVLIVVILALESVVIVHVEVSRSIHIQRKKHAIW